MTFKFEILIFGKKMRMDVNNFEFIYLLIMDEFHPMIYLIEIINKIHPYEIIHPCRWIKITLNFKFQAQASCSCRNHL